MKHPPAKLPPRAARARWTTQAAVAGAAHAVVAAAAAGPAAKAAAVAAAVAATVAISVVQPGKGAVRDQLPARRAASIGVVQAGGTVKFIR